ncbi:hypothetical protein HPP92_008243 [Vanilla planifolia]|uniref:protein-serine/threonine phosphatase n=1 Tax=Vanilla planifolia TaxID=51239 RepID=A0A835R9B3_VANPL|nr:hypothetical protein HPP92_008243 [Vanilla planifolia]
MSKEEESCSKCLHACRRRIEIRNFSNFASDMFSDIEIQRRVEKRTEASTSEVFSHDKRRRTETLDTPLLATPTALSPESLSSFSTASSDGETQFLATASSSSLVLPAVTPILFGSVSLSGRAREMEDAISVQPEFFRTQDGSTRLHFFAVFDGHGGSHVSALCKEKMHTVLAEELAALAAEEMDEHVWRSAVKRCFVRMDHLALSACACGRVGQPLCRCERSGIESEIVGSTAVVSIISEGSLLVANCGDSRAVLSRGGKAVPLSSDHKPDRPDELARIEAAGGRVIFVNGARVHGILAMSRALGDKYLKPVVTSEPEFFIRERTPEDECLILASDGLWDVLSNELACSVARKCLAEGGPALSTEDISSTSSAAEEANVNDGQKPEARCSMAAALLARLALGRRSTDNISVIVIDLRKR